MRILVIEDDPATVRMLARGLGAHGYQILSADNGEDGARLATTEPVDLVLLDVALPRLDGHDTLARIRAARPDLPVVMLTARNALQDKVAALDAGADDYLTKPFALEELLARIRALARGVARRGFVLRAGDASMDVLARRVRRGRTPVELSSREFALLEYLLRHPGQVLSRARLLAAVWGPDAAPDSNLVDVYVGYLRRKLDRPGQPSLIATVRGAGYRLVPPGARRSRFDRDPIRRARRIGTPVRQVRHPHPAARRVDRSRPRQPGSETPDHLLDAPEVTGARQPPTDVAPAAERTKERRRARSLHGEQQDLDPFRTRST